jgi:hypothetical protein
MENYDVLPTVMAELILERRGIETIFAKRQVNTTYLF